MAPSTWVTLVVAVLVVATAVASLVQRAHAHQPLLGGAPLQPPALHQPLPAASGVANSSRSDDPVHGLDTTITVGTCFSVSSASGRGETFTRQDCAAEHSEEFVGFERATGSDDAFPDDFYWRGPVANQCDQDVVAYSGLPRDAWPEGFGSYAYRPTYAGWTAGDRTVYCTAHWTPAHSGSARNLTAAPVRAIGPDASSAGGNGTVVPPVSVEVTVTGVLTVIASPTDAAGSPECLALNSADGWWLVQPGSSRFSSRATTRDGAVDVARSGIVAGPDPSGPVVWHAGSSVTLTGASFPAAGYPSSTCGLSTAIYVTDVR